MLYHLPSHYDNLVIQLYQFDEACFTSANVQKALIAEFDHLSHCTETVSGLHDGTSTKLSSETK